MKFYAESIIEILPEEILVFFNYVKQLGTEEKPNYSYLLNLFEVFFEKNKTGGSYIEFDWVIDIKKKNRKSSKNLRSLTNSQLNARKRNFYNNLDSISMEIPKITKKKSFKAQNELNEVVKPLKEDE